MSSFLGRAAVLQYKVLDRLRHPEAFRIARDKGTVTDLSAFRSARQCLLVTFKRSGEPVPSPVNFGLSDDGLLYFRCEPDVAKVKRLQHDPHVRVCPCSFRGKPRGSLVEASARVLPADENERAHAIIASNWDIANRIYERAIDRMNIPLLYVEVSPVGKNGEVTGT